MMGRSITPQNNRNVFFYRQKAALQQSVNMVAHTMNTGITVIIYNYVKLD